MADRVNGVVDKVNGAKVVNGTKVGESHPLQENHIVQKGHSDSDSAN